MRVFRRRAFGLAIPLFALFSLPAHSQNLLLNPGFDRDLSGWDVRTEFYPPANVDASVQWEATDVLGGASGSVRFRLHGGRQTVNRVQLTQCFPAAPGRRYTGGGLVRTDDELQHGVFVNVELFSTTGCSGDPVTSSSGGSLLAAGFTHVNSGGLWLPATASAVAGADGRSVRFSTGIYAATGSYYSSSSFDGLFDDAYLIETPDPAPSWILPAAGRGVGAAGSLWTTTLTLANPGPTDALVTLKFLGHDADGRTGDEKTFLVRAGTLVEYPDALGNLFGLAQGYGAIRITSSTANLVVQSETSTPFSSGGTVGQALPTLGPADYASATPKTLGPIRENAAFRTNLVLANVTEIPITAHVVLFAADGTQIGVRDVELPPLGMTQISRVASALGASDLEAGRLSLTTPTPGGLLAAYVSVIDNVSNDPRAFLPNTAAVFRPPSTNLLANPGFDSSLDGWTLKTGKSGNGTTGSGWSRLDSRGSPASGSASLWANAPGANPAGDSAFSSLSQCIGVSAGTAYSLRATVAAGGWGFFSFPRPGIVVQYYGSGDCTGVSLGESGVAFRPLSSADLGAWHTEATSFAAAPPGSRTALVTLSAGAGGSIHGSGISADFDDVFFGTVSSVWEQLLPSAAHIRGENGSFWTTDLTIENPGPEDATVYLLSRAFVVPAGRLLGVSDVLGDPAGYRAAYGPLRIVSTSPGVTVQSQTSTPLPAGGTAGAGLAAFAANDLVGAAPKSLVPIRESRSFRTNLVLLNAAETPVTVHVELFAADGTSLGRTDVELPGLAMKQINQVAGTFGFWDLEAGRLAVSTDTPGGTFAAYASVIDNVTNDPRTILPR